MKLIIVLSLIGYLAVKDVYCAMTEAQIKAAVKLIRNVCVPKTKITPAQLEELHQGGFSQDDNVKVAYMECVVRTAQIFKDGKLNYEGAKSQMANLPVGMSEAAINTLDNCKDKITSSDKFVSAYQFYKCYYDDNPSNFYLP